MPPCEIFSGALIDFQQIKSISKDDFNESLRVTAVELIDEARANGCRLKPACDELNITPRTYQRWNKEGNVKKDQRPLIKRPTPKNKLTKE